MSDDGKKAERFDEMVARLAQDHADSAPSTSSANELMARLGAPGTSTPGVPAPGAPSSFSLTGRTAPTGVSKMTDLFDRLAVARGASSHSHYHPIIMTTRRTDFDDDDGVIHRPLKVEQLSRDQQDIYHPLLSWCQSARSGIKTLGGYAGTGKGQPLHAEVMTPLGPKTMGSLHVGSPVSNPDGSVAKVIAVHELGERDIYRVEFSDGAHTFVTLDHLWLVKHAGKHLKANRKDQGGNAVWGRVETTEQLIAYFQLQKKLKRKSLLLVPLTEPVALTVNKHDNEPVDPYVLGALCGDGDMTQAATFTSDDADLVREIERRLCHLSTSDGSGHRIPVGTGVRDGLQQLGLWGKHAYQQHVPDLYRTGPLERRWAFVRGLMDTAGTVNTRGNVSFTSTSRQLVLDLQWMLRSLGFRAAWTSRVPSCRDENGQKTRGRPAYTLLIQGRNLSSLFFLPRKKSCCPADFNGGQSEVARRMVSIKPAGRAVCRCITVDHPNGLYVTDGFIVTHNSTLVGLLADTITRSKRVGLCAYTGKAAGVLRRKLAQQGVETSRFPERPGLGMKRLSTPVLPFAGTIHSLMYTPEEDPESGRVIGWTRQDEMPYDLIVVDEASMVTRKIFKDLSDYRRPILAVGDHGQLPPVGDGKKNAQGEFEEDLGLMANPFWRLEKIHRQAEDSPIITLSRLVRENGGFRSTSSFDGKGKVQLLNMRGMQDKLEELYCSGLESIHDIAVLTYTNYMRQTINAGARRIFGRSGAPVEGDQVVCLRNTESVVFNGMRGLIVSPVTEHERYWYNATISFPDEHLEVECSFLKAQVGRPETYKDWDEIQRDTGFRPRSKDQVGLLLDYGYALTCHKMQGSQAKHVFVVLERPSKVSDDQYARWTYTAVTRSTDYLYLVVV